MEPLCLHKGGLERTHCPARPAHTEPPHHALCEQCAKHDPDQFLSYCPLLCRCARSVPSVSRRDARVALLEWGCHDLSPQFAHHSQVIHTHVSKSCCLVAHAQ